MTLHIAIEATQMKSGHGRRYRWRARECGKGSQVGNPARDLRTMTPQRTLAAGLGTPE
ncbi:hypothetical protein [Stenotrophomonas lactitubi]|jgi:hypothetical protein|uniref:hypothetical protein n=1 Tax=Stenotrophomonas lactitubi TaxID=2045214 RepID=UPI001DFD4CF3|nr:hypothetical protein [Stenotrophomonas lactitubi]HED4874948.1 hypothetical protein [Stenotrophomonas maltophilia]CAH0127577.1 hypothetical protein SRABI66_00131 [Stenotrophomonas lactitubi]CAH0127873.1 hypothetical protein SRABI81_00142 [Stenotrophomonas lactitubi]CAH0134511.1 hypothetical protein SRABI102_00145 [Stenotrophomonas lactitubi]CAH0169711.1 hypothetical protein SRABI122_01143 [Stenotrophomonas lactitubi]